MTLVLRSMRVQDRIEGRELSALGEDDTRSSTRSWSGTIAAQHGIKVIILDRLDRIASDARLPDGQHFSATGHAKFAGHLAPKVRAAGACAK
jgi:lysophospholipase L1-like esterase